MKSRVRLCLKRFAEGLAGGQFRSQQKNLIGFDIEEVRKLQPGDTPTASSFDALRSFLWKRYYLRVKRAEKTCRALFALDHSLSLSKGWQDQTKLEVMFRVAEELGEGLAEGSNEVGFLVWSSKVDEYFPPLSGVNRMRERLSLCERHPTRGGLTNAPLLFEYFLTLSPQPTVIFVFSDWHDSGDFREELKQCLAAKFDIIPIALIDQPAKETPRFIGDIITASAEDPAEAIYAGFSDVIPALEIFAAEKLPFIIIKTGGDDDLWRDAFVTYFEAREKEREAR